MILPSESSSYDIHVFFLNLCSWTSRGKLFFSREQFSSSSSHYSVFDVNNLDSENYNFVIAQILFGRKELLCKKKLFFLNFRKKRQHFIQFNSHSKFFSPSSKRYYNCENFVYVNRVNSSPLFTYYYFCINIYFFCIFHIFIAINVRKRGKCGKREKHWNSQADRQLI